MRIVREAFVKSGLVHSGTELGFNITITSGDAVIIEVLDPKKNDWYHVKASRYIDFSSEFDQCQLARQRYGRFAPEPLIVEKMGMWSIFVTRSIPHRPLRRSDLAARATSSCAWEDLFEFLSRSKAGSFPHNRGVNHANFREKLTSYGTQLPEIAKRVFTLMELKSASILDKVPCVAQHGDFVLNNLGWTKDGLIVFDWEDFGTTTLCGFDVCLLSLSVAGMSSSAARSIQTAEDPADEPWHFAPQACQILGLPYSTFRALVPYYILTFRFLKRNYGSDIRARIDEVLNGVLPSS